jgi:hypothetical protein
MLSRNKIIFIIAIILVNTALALGLYSNCHMDNMLNEVDTAVVVQAMAYRENNMGQEQEYERLTQAEGSRWNHNWQNFVIWMQDILPFLNLYIVNIFSFKPGRFCLNSTGLPSLTLTNIAIISKTGANTIIAHKDKIKSIGLFMYFLYTPPLLTS